jgi:actin-related protein
MRRELANNIVVAGGNTMFDGFLERLTREITFLAHPGA